MKLCIMHCGQPKTGTSSLQRYLAANADRLREHGILYPVFQRRKTELEAVPWAGYQHGVPLKSIARSASAHAKGSKSDQFLRSIEELPHDVLLLSAEFLFKLLFLYNRKYERTWEYFTDRGYQIETITYLRDQPDRLNSAYIQQTKTANTHASFEEFCEKRMGDSADEDESGSSFFYDRLLAPALHATGVDTSSGRTPPTCELWGSRPISWRRYAPSSTVTAPGPT